MAECFFNRENGFFFFFNREKCLEHEIFCFIPKALHSEQMLLGMLWAQQKLIRENFCSSLQSGPAQSLAAVERQKSLWERPVLFSWEAAGLGDGSQSCCWPFKDWMQALCIQWGILKQEDFFFNNTLGLVFSGHKGSCLTSHGDFSNFSHCIFSSSYLL